MRLTAIKLAGFKSFVDPTTLALDGNLTGIVGPNGCGKSNVIDAVRWVTGESSAKQLRGEALEDVIFNGSKARKPVGRAAIELKFDNSEGKLGGQYARFSEIAIRRELSREGASRYFINGARARRRDVVDLFLGTGLGGRSNYAVIEQGAVNRLVEAKPDDLRQVLEEAAGISRYKERRRETENRIRHTRENLDRLNDLITEVSQRLAVLKRQAANAEKYKTFKRDERRLRAELLALRWHTLDAGVQQAGAHLEQQQRSLASAVSRQREARVARETENRAQQAAVEACQTHQAAFYDAQGQTTRIAQALAHARQLREMYERERTDLQDRHERLGEREVEDSRALERIEQAIAAAATEQQARQDEHENARDTLTRAEAAAVDAEQQWDSYNSTEQTPVQQLEAERTQRRYLANRLDQVRATRDKRGAEAEALAPQHSDAELREGDARLETLETQLAAGTADLQAQTQMIAQLREQAATLDRRHDETRTALAEQQARLASEKTLQQAVLREDDSGLRQWLSAQGYADARSLARHVSAPEDWQGAVEAALGEWLSGFAVARLPAAGAPVPEWPADALVLVETCERPPPPTEPPQSMGGLPSLASRIQAPEVVMALARHVFVADSVQTALNTRANLRPGQLIVSRDGACVGAATLRTPASQSASQGVLQREKNIEALEADVSQKQAALDALTSESDALAGCHGDARQVRSALEQRLERARRDLSECHAEQQGRRMRAEQVRRRGEELAEELAALDRQIRTDRSELDALDGRIGTLAEHAHAFAERRSAARSELSETRSRRDAARDIHEAAERATRQIDQAVAAERSRHESLSSRLADTRAARGQIAERLAGFELPPQDDAGTDAHSEADHDAAKACQGEAERALRDARAELEAIEERGQAAARDAMSADTAVEAARETMQQAKIDYETASVRRQSLVEQLDELGENAVALLANLDDTANPEAWQAEIEMMERKIARLGAINLAAIEEYDAEAGRETYLNTQHADLSEALATLENAIAKIDRETRSRFRHTYAQVNERFGAMFPILFGGGQAALELTEDDLLSTGVRVMARPPGKRNASIQMLSGGEKALTAVALLFALFELNPAPFCMLDEIDAPLDDANVSRFCELVRRMSAHVQFIVITHNKLTMELTEQLHGVTMAEPGVSRLVSVNIDQALDMAG